jgi:2-dehydro-3-deoxygluconokinase
LAGARVLHLSGITAALSPSCLQLMRAAILERRLAPAIVSFDVNYREALWPPHEAAPVLAELANSSDLVFIGLDEAEALWGCKTTDDVRAMLPNAGTLIVKNDAHGAESLSLEGRVFTPSPSVEVVESVGAGDAFAAGYLSGLLRGWAEEQRLRLGHLVAAQALFVTSDHAAIPSLEWFLDHVALPREKWEGLELTLRRTVVK